MDSGLFDVLEKRIESLVDGYAALKAENTLLRKENERLTEDREQLKDRVDSIIRKLEGI